MEVLSDKRDTVLTVGLPTDDKEMYLIEDIVHSLGVRYTVTNRTLITDRITYYDAHSMVMRVAVAGRCRWVNVNSTSK